MPSRSRSVKPSGPCTSSQPFSLAQRSTVANRALATCSSSMKSTCVKRMRLVCHFSLALWLRMAPMRPTISPLRMAIQQRASQYSKAGFFFLFQSLMSSSNVAGTNCGTSLYKMLGYSTNCRSWRFVVTSMMETILVPPYRHSFSVPQDSPKSNTKRVETARRMWYTHYQ